jgi:tetratricopeptide (TPR) repeat protein
VIALVRSLLAIGELNLAQRQTDAAVGWVRSLNRRNPERALIWGVAQAYLEFGYPQRALELLQQWRIETGLRQRLTTLFGAQMNDDDLRLKRLRLQALLSLRKGAYDGEINALTQELRTAAPRLLDGDALISFYADGLLRPLLAAGRIHQAWALLPEICAALAVGSGSKHGARVREISVLLARQVRLEAARGEESSMSREPLTRFLLELWRRDVEKGIWQVVHSVEGAIPLLLALEGPSALVAVGEAAAGGWGKTRE